MRAESRSFCIYLAAMAAVATAVLRAAHIFWRRRRRRADRHRARERRAPARPLARSLLTHFDWADKNGRARESLDRRHRRRCFSSSRRLFFLR